MKIGIIVATLPGEARAYEVLGAPAPYREALDSYKSALADPSLAGKYASLELWTKTGVSKRSKLRGVAPVEEPAPAPAPPKKAASPAAKKAVAAAKKLGPAEDDAEL